MPAFVAIQEAADFAEIKLWKQGTALHAHSEQGEIGLQNIFISSLANLVCPS